MTSDTKCPFNHTAGGTSNRDWWPEQLRLDIHHQHSAKSDPMGGAFNYAEEFTSLDLAALKKDLATLMTDSQNFWPADFGHYGPLFVWRGTGPAPTGPVMAVVAAAEVSSALRHSTAGQTTSTSTRPVACSGRSSRSMERRFPRPI